MVVTLVHGTWARNAPWIRPDSAFLRHFVTSLPNVHVEPFLWSGSNSHRARCQAAIELRRHIAICVQKYPAQDHFIVAHSHGGNVALYALRDSQTAVHVRGVACLSTPFLHCRRRNFGPAGLTPILSLAVVSWYLLSFIGVRTLTHSIQFPPLLGFMQGFLDEWQGSLFLASVFALALYKPLKSLAELSMRCFIRHIIGVYKDCPMSEAVLHSFRVSSLRPDSVLVIRAAGDEASAALAISHLPSIILSALSRAINSIAKLGFWLMDLNDRLPRVTRIKYLLLSWSLGGLLGYISFYFHEHRDVPYGTYGKLLAYLSLSLFYIGMSFIHSLFFMTAGFVISGVVGAVLLGLLVLVTIISFPFGLDTALLSPVFEISAETSPPGRFTTVQLSDCESNGLWHSSSHESEETSREIASWIAHVQDSYIASSAMPNSPASVETPRVRKLP